MNSGLPAGPDRRHRLRLLWLIAALWTVLVCVSAALLMHERLREHREHTWYTAAVRVASIKDNLLLTFRQLAALPKNLAHRPSVLAFLSIARLPDTSALNDEQRRQLGESQLHDPSVQAMNTILDDTVADFGLPLALLTDAAGNIVANGIADKKAVQSLLAGNLRSLEYFNDALHKGTSSQFLLGGESGVPGLYFASRVERDSRLLGVAVIKQDSEAVNHLLTDAGGSLICVSDVNGVVVLSNKAVSLMRRLPNSRPQTPPDWNKVYQREPAPLNWRLSQTRVAGQPVMTAEWAGMRHLALSTPLGEMPFTVWVVAPLGEAAPITMNVAVGAFVVWLMGCLLIWAGWRRLQLLDFALQARRELLDMAQALPLTVFRYQRPATGSGGRFSFLGRGVQQLFGVDPDTLDQDPTLPWRLAGEPTNTPPTEPREFAVRHGNRAVWVLAHSTPLKQTDGSTVYNGYWLDISARREAQERFAAVFEHAPNGFLFFDRKRGVTHCNPAALRLFGIDDPQRLLGRTVWFPDLSPDVQPNGQASRDRALELMHRHTASGARVQSHEWRFRRVDGSTFDADVSVIALDSELEPQFCAVVQDITTRKQTEVAMREAREAAEAASHTKSSFLANMSHELRTPMNAIIGMTHLALDDGLPPKQRDYIEKAHHSARNLLQILNDILDVSKIEAGHMALERVEFELESVVAEMADVLSIKADEKGLPLRYTGAPELPARLVGDPTRLRQVLVNLGSNAIKFTDRGEVVVGMDVGALDAQAIELHGWVRDTGVGLTEEELARLFQPFMQADSSTTRRFGGTGLGLVICRQLVERMGGRLWVDSEAGKGSTFHFTARFGLPEQMPAAPPRQVAGKPSARVQRVLNRAGGAQAGLPHSPEPEIEPSLRERLAGARILLVEDHPLNQELACELLRRAGMDVVVADNGLEALRKLAGEGPFDGVLMDCQMPVMDGYTATRRIRADPALRDVPVIAMTASALAEDRERALASGMNAHLTKPLNVPAMLATMAQWIRSPRAAGPPTEPLPSTDWVPLDSSGPIDTADGLARCLGKPHLYRRILQGFHEANVDFAASVRQSCDAGRWDEAMRRAHDLKGLAGTIGAHALHTSAQSLQAAFAARDEKAVRDWLPQVSAELAEALREIERIAPAQRDSLA